MATRNFHKNRTKERKKRQADARVLLALRKKALDYEGVTARNVLRKSADELRRIIKHGKYRPHLYGPMVFSEAIIICLILGCLSSTAFAKCHAYDKSHQEKTLATKNRSPYLR